MKAFGIGLAISSSTHEVLILLRPIDICWNYKKRKKKYNKYVSFHNEWGWTGYEGSEIRDNFKPSHDEHKRL